MKFSRLGAAPVVAVTRTVVGFAFVVASLAGAVPVNAGVADAPLPRFSDGVPAVLVRTVPGIVKRGRLQTDFLCTSLASAPTDIGIEIFNTAGALLNDIGQGVGVVLGVAPGQTVTIGTSGTAAYLESVIIPIAGVAQGSARIVAGTGEVRCNVVVVDSAVTPPGAVALLGNEFELEPGASLTAVELPRFSNGRAATHSALIPGVIKRGRMQTDVFCTSLAAQSIDLGLEIFAPDGTRLNDLTADNGAVLNVAPGETATIGTTGTAAFLETAIMVIPGVAQGLGRLVSTSGDVVCTAFVLDSNVTPPIAMSALFGSANRAPAGTPTPSFSPTPELPPTDTVTPSRTATATISPTPAASATPIVGCTGDCAGDGAVTVDDLIKGVNIALGVLHLDQCSAFDWNEDGAVTVEELIRAVRAALNGCVLSSA